MARGGYEHVATTDSSEQLQAPMIFSSSAQAAPGPTIYPLASARLADGDMPMLSVNRDLEDTFNASEPSDSDGMADDDRERLIRDAVSGASGPSLRNSGPTTEYSATNRVAQNTAPSGKFSHPNDGVFANLNAKPESGDKVEEQPPSYEQAAADATPPYWETTILAPGMVSDEVYIDGLPVGSFFSFVWNGIISMAFHLVGFLLTYLLHTTHAAKHGSRAGLGVTLISYGFTMRSISSRGEGQKDSYYQPTHPDSHNFKPSTATSTIDAAAHSAGNNSGNHPSGEWFSYLLMVVGWVILIKAVTDFIRARRHEQLILQSPERSVNASGPESIVPSSIV